MDSNDLQIASPSHSNAGAGEAHSAIDSSAYTNVNAVAPKCKGWNRRCIDSAVCCSGACEYHHLGIGSHGRCRGGKKRSNATPKGACFQLNVACSDESQCCSGNCRPFIHNGPAVCIETRASSVNEERGKIPARKPSPPGKDKRHWTADGNRWSGSESDSDSNFEKRDKIPARKPPPPGKDKGHWTADGNRWSGSESDSDSNFEKRDKIPAKEPPPPGKDKGHWTADGNRWSGSESDSDSNFKKRGELPLRRPPPSGESEAVEAVSKHKMRKRQFNAYMAKLEYKTKAAATKATATTLTPTKRVEAAAVRWMQGLPTPGVC